MYVSINQLCCLCINVFSLCNYEAGAAGRLNFLSGYKTASDIENNAGR